MGVIVLAGIEVLGVQRSLQVISLIAAAYLLTWTRLRDVASIRSWRVRSEGLHFLTRDSPILLRPCHRFLWDLSELLPDGVVVVIPLLRGIVDLVTRRGRTYQFSTHHSPNDRSLLPRVVTS